MTDFNYVNEMVHGKKHMNILNYDKDSYDLVSIVSNLFDKDLSSLHDSALKNYELFTIESLGKDSDTEFHNLFYNKLHSGWDELINTYEKFIKEVILPYLELDEALVQVTPTFRVQLPNNKAVVVNHYDSDELHNHPKGEINFIYALTDMYDTNTVYVEKMSRMDEYQKIELKAGQCISFNGNTCSHYNNINKTGKTRVSFDFRVLPLNYYNPNNNIETITTKRKYIEGSYYKRFKIDNSKYKARDVWDKAKEGINESMVKYNVKDPWDLVDLFERRVAEYSGSKYAVSVDNCTDGMFLCLKYLNYTGTVTIPSRTYCSVPCTIINAGCKVEFEDVEWSGAYQLKPTPVYDGAVRFKKGMYKENTFHCLSFHIRKHVPIGKGGMILCDDYEAYKWFRTSRYEGRHIADGVMYKDDIFDMVGWNMYMTPEQAARGLDLLANINDDNPDQESSGTHKDLSIFPVYTDPFFNESKNYSLNYWFNEETNDFYNGGEDYYVNTFFKEIVLKLDDIPKEGKIVVLGTHNCVSFDKLCKHFGYDRCIGYDLHNPKNHPNVIIKDCSKLTDEDNIDIAFIHNDLGNYASTPKLKEYGQRWASKNVIKGGYMLGNNNYNRAKVDNIKIMEENGLENYQLVDLQDKYDLSKLDYQRIEGYMLSKKM